MSLHPSSAHLADLRHHIHLLIGQSADHMHHLQELVASAERDCWDAQSEASQSALGVSAVRQLLRDCGEQRASTAATATQLYRGALQQRDAACELLVRLDDCRAADSSVNAVLVVDDYGDVRDFIAAVLCDAGFVVRTAANGLEALIAANEMRPGVIVMDLVMPVLGGLEATRLIKASESTRKAKVIAYTAEAPLDPILMQQLFAAMLQKPATPDMVLATVQQVARQ